MSGVTIPRKTVVAAFLAAARYRAVEQPSGGVVLIWENRAYGWKNVLRDPQHERPGALAVDFAGSIWVASGGNDQDGAAEWLQLDLDTDGSSYRCVPPQQEAQ